MKPAFLSACLILALASPALAEPAGPTSFYIGGGSNTGDGADGKTPFSFGVMHQVEGRKLVLGFDIANEGVMTDSTWGGESQEGALSMNLLVGANLVTTDKVKWDAAALIGMRESSADCPDSYLGYRCYADQEPETEYKGNFGLVTTVSYQSFLMGLRVTGESAQALVGIRF